MITIIPSKKNDNRNQKNPPTLHSHHRTEISLVVIVVVGAVRPPHSLGVLTVVCGGFGKESYPIISKFLRERVDKETA